MLDSTCPVRSTAANDDDDDDLVGERLRRATDATVGVLFTGPASTAAYAAIATTSDGPVLDAPSWTTATTNAAAGVPSADVESDTVVEIDDATLTSSSY